MAGWVQDGGGQQGFNIGYHPDWYSGANPFAVQTDNYNNQHSILNTNEDAFMTNFFNDPDAAPADDGIYNMNWPVMDEKPNGTGLGGHWAAQTINSPLRTLAGPSNTNYQTHSNQRHSPHTPSGEFVTLPQNHTSTDVNEAANGLMFMNSHQESHLAQPFDNVPAGLWNNLGGRDSTMHMQETFKNSSGRPSVNSYHRQSHDPAQTMQHYQNGFLSNQVMMGHNRQLQQIPHHPAYNHGTRHSSLPLDPSSFTFFPQEQPRTPQSALFPGQGSSRPPLVHFGSDQNFKEYGYTGLGNHVPVEHEKGANLNNVPFAHQVAASSHLHMQPVTPMTPSHYTHHMFPNGPETYNPASTSSSPNTLGGLPTTKMAPTPNHRSHGHPSNSAARATAAAEYEGESDADADFEDTRPLKRRKSQLEAEDDAEYTPGKHHVRAPALKRGSKSSKVPAFDGSDDDDDYEGVPSSTRASVKRRKSSTNARPSLGSSQSGSPAAMASPTGRPTTASGKKKVRGSQPRTNLTEDEKRRNHIASEKTRRDLIRLQYDQLDGMVPALKEGKSGLSRSDILKEIAVFVEGTIKGNKKIEDMFSGPPPDPRYGGYG